MSVRGENYTVTCIIFLGQICRVNIINECHCAHSQYISELPAFVFLRDDRIFRYQGDVSHTLSADRMRSYALQGFLNQGTGDLLLKWSCLLLVKTKYTDWLFNYGAGSNRVDEINGTALVIGGFVLGLIICAVVAITVLVCFVDDSATSNEKRLKKKKN